MTPTVRVLDDAETAAIAAAERLRELARVALQRRSRFTLAVSGGRTPEPMFRALASGPAGLESWSSWQLFWCDERLVPPEDPRSNFGLARRLWLAPAGFPAENARPIRTDLPAGPAADAYDAVLRSFFGAASSPTFDAVVLGLGPDGHTASLFPGSPSLDVTDRSVVAEPNPGQPPFVPRVTLTLEALGRARTALFLVTGADKRGPLARILGRAGTSPDVTLPAARVRALESVEWFLDRGAADGRAPEAGTGDRPARPPSS